MSQSTEKPSRGLQGTGADGVGTPAVLPEQDKVRPWEKMPRKVWELLEDMDDDPDTRTEMTVAAVRYLFTGVSNMDFKGTKRLVYKSICLDIDMYKDITKKRESAGRKGGKFHKRKAKTDLVKQNDDLLENAEAKEEDALARKEIRGKSKEIRDKNGTNVPINDTNVSQQKQQKQQNNGDDKKYWEIIALWNFCLTNTTNAACRIHPVKTVLTDRRREAIREFMNICDTPEKVKVAFARVMSSQFCNGMTARRKNPVEFDWVIKPDNIVRVIEGNL